MGIKRDAKSLGYATSAVQSEEMTINRTPNFMNSLQGKVAGVNITSLGSGPAGTSKIRIRGQSSVGGQNQPLIVVNGVPIDNTNFGANPGNGIGIAVGGDDAGAFAGKGQRRGAADAGAGGGHECGLAAQPLQIVVLLVKRLEPAGRGAVWQAIEIGLGLMW